MFLLPGLWVLAVVLWELLSPLGTRFIELLAAAPAIACAGTGRRQCVLMGGGCALLALLPFGGHDVPSGTRLGTCCAILVVVAASYLTTGRRLRLAAELEWFKEIATTTQRALLRPVPPRLAQLALAGGHLSATRGSLLGGDLYEALATPHGVRVVIGDVRGHGLPALATVAALLGSFRDAAHDEAELPDVLRRLERSLQRHLAADRTGHPTEGQDGAGAEEFATLLLLEIRPRDEVLVLNCGHPWPHRLTTAVTGGRCALTEAPGEPLPPLGMFPLPARLPPQRLHPLRPGEALVLHTDGAEDARDPGGGFFPLTLALTEAAREDRLVPGLVVQRVQTALLAHTGGPLADDVALLVLYHQPLALPTPHPPLASSSPCP